MLDLSREEKAKHRLPRWFSEAPTWISTDRSRIRNRSWNLSEVFTASEFPYCALKAWRRPVP